MPAQATDQQPVWPDAGRALLVRRELAAKPPLVRADDVRALRSLLADVAAGEAHVLQAGDCAEDPADRGPAAVAGKVVLLDLLAGELERTTGTPVVRVGRIAGQYAKPRSRATESVGGVELPVYRGHLVNGPEPDPASRRPDPRRLLSCYDAASTVLGLLRGTGVWSSHEALLLDYEEPLLRRDGPERVLTSTHWPWIGNRTNRAGGRHAGMLAGVANPVAAKVGPGVAVADLLALCARLDPHREPGRLTFVARMGADAVAARLPPLVTAVRAAGHPVIWLTDPLHGNTVATPDGRKTRVLTTVVREVVAFQEAVAAGGGVAGGLHLETTPDPVTECAADESGIDSRGDGYTSLCDPRLNPEQAIEVVSAWRALPGTAKSP
ncbi:3-deoxy-7-phosphoheptulonate synthase [Actinokineospora sp. PR83]|uniref:3-deoxy-7-phosphoheptulonate synthase n=1 Tax=Actinokineospora sp. PR83 TaxID=2884908 RepID=UPI0035ABFF23